MNGKGSEPAPAINWSRAAQRVGIAVLALLLAAALLQSGRDVKTFVGVDLVPKIGGAQRFFAHVSPYVAWTPAQTGFLPDADAGMPFPSRCSYPPTMLLFYGIGCHFNYRLLRYAWALAEWAALLASIALFVVTSKTAVERWGSACVGIVFFACSYFFRFHVERGQYYVFVTLFWALAWANSRRRGLNSYGTGIFLGIAAAIRPTSLPALIPLAVFGSRRALIGSAAAFLVLIATTLATGGVGAWVDFARLVRFVAKATVTLPPFQPPGPVPGTLAGYDAVALLDSKSTNTSVLAQLLTIARFFHLKTDDDLWPLAAQLIVGVALLFAIVWMARTGRSKNERQIMLWSLFIALICDFAAPVRFGYADVLDFVPIAAALPYLLASFSRGGIAGFSGPLVFSAFCWSLVVDTPSVSTLARTACVMAGLGILMLADSGAASRDPIRREEWARERANPPVA